MEESYFTSKTVTEEKKSLNKIQIGRTWIYTDSFETFKKHSENHLEKLLEILERYPICRFSFLATMAKKEPTISVYEFDYIRYIVNMACSFNQAYKILCRDHKNKIYACYFSLSKADIVQQILIESYEKLLSNTELGFKQIANDFFQNQKGSYYWAKAILEHLVYLGMAYHIDEWRVAY